MDFISNPSGAAKSINDWVEDQTRQRIRNLIPAGALTKLTRLVLVNAIYLKAPWAEPFQTSFCNCRTRIIRSHFSSCYPTSGTALLRWRQS
ncbi:MAG: hypothetical protein DME22_05360 [Verrucomicrobia bacterium]|nr:MAG: hypothetical protein DME22_05360 [Verrucomicrobiota bacterium]